VRPLSLCERRSSSNGNRTREESIYFLLFTYADASSNAAPVETRILWF
jgi:hypothetical protein